MLNKVHVVGMVLSTMPIGDYDKRITILTTEKGKISAFARGSRKPNSPFLAVCQPFAFGEFDLAEGRSAYSISSAKITNYFTELRNDITWVCYGMYFCEFAEYICRENNDEKEVLKLLYQSLKAVTMPQIGTELVRYIFDLRMIYINGEGPQVFECIKCGCDDKEVMFSVKSGGIVCSDCLENGRNIASDAVCVSKTALYTLQFIISKPIEKLYTFTVTNEVLLEIKRLVEAYRREYVGHEMKSLKMLREFQ